MKYLLFILLLSSCMTSKDPVEMKVIKVAYLKSSNQIRWIGGEFRETRKFLYRGDNDIIYCIDDSLLSNFLYVQR